MLTRQQSHQRMFDAALAHLRTTRTLSMDAKGYCQYGGTGCALAPSIRELSTSLEGHGAHYLYSNCAHVLHEWAQPASPTFAHHLQNRLHDRFRGGGYSEDELMGLIENGAIHLAQQYDLRYTPPLDPSSGDGEFR